MKVHESQLQQISNSKVVHFYREIVNIYIVWGNQISAAFLVE